MARCRSRALRINWTCLRETASSLARAGCSNRGQVVRHLASEECGSMVGVAQVHRELMPRPVLKDGHIPGTGNGVGKLPNDLVAFLIREPLQIRLNDRIPAFP